MFRISLRELFAAVALVAFAIVSLKYASEDWVAIVAGVAMACFFAALVTATVGRGSMQASSIGFVLIMATYGLIVFNPIPNISRGAEFDHMQGRLPTTRLLRYIHAAVGQSQWIDSSTGKEIPNFDPANPSIPMSGSGGFQGAGPTAGYREIPQRELFMPIGHLWWGLLFGYIGGRFARFVYTRRVQEREN